MLRFSLWVQLMSNMNSTSFKAYIRNAINIVVCKVFDSIFVFRPIMSTFELNRNVKWIQQFWKPSNRCPNLIIHARKSLKIYEWTTSSQKQPSTIICGLGKKILQLLKLKIEHFPTVNQASAKKNTLRYINLPTEHLKLLICQLWQVIEGVSLPCLHGYGPGKKNKPDTFRKGKNKLYKLKKSFFLFVS